MKYPREKNLDPRNTHEIKIQTHKIPTRKNLRPTEQPLEKIWDAQSTHEKKFWTHKIPTRNFRPAKARWHGATGPTRPTMTQHPQNLAHSFDNKNITGEMLDHPDTTHSTPLETYSGMCMTSWIKQVVQFLTKFLMT